MQYKYFFSEKVVERIQKMKLFPTMKRKEDDELAIFLGNQVYVKENGQILIFVNV